MPYRTQMPTGHAFLPDLNARDDQHDVRLALREVSDLRRLFSAAIRSEAVVDLRAVVDGEDVDGAISLVDPVDDPVGAAAGSMTAGQGTEQRVANAVRVDGEGGLAEFQYRGGDCLR
jgi:hypothetical protein